MRTFLLLIAVTFCSDALAGEPVDIPPRRPPTRTSQSGPRLAIATAPQPPRLLPTAGRLEDLRKAAEHLESAGLMSEANRIENIIRAVKQGNGQTLLAEKTRALAELQSEVDLLRELTRRQTQIVLKFQALEYSVTKLRALGLNPDELTELDQQSNPGVNSAADNFNITNDAKKLQTFAQQLIGKRIAKVLAEPTLVTVSGRPAHFHSGGEIPIAKPLPDGNVAVDFLKIGTSIDTTPKLTPKGKVQLELELSLAERDEALDFVVGEQTMPGVRTRRLSTAVEMNPGETVAFQGLSQKRNETRKDAEGKEIEVTNEFRMLVFLTLEKADIGPTQSPAAGE